MILNDVDDKLLAMTSLLWSIHINTSIFSITARADDEPCVCEEDGDAAAGRLSSQAKGRIKFLKEKL